MRACLWLYVLTCALRSTSQPEEAAGRLGAYIDNAKPDIRPLESYCELVREGDILLLVSDGVHANLDPRYARHVIGHVCMCVLVCTSMIKHCLCALALKQAHA